MSSFKTTVTKTVLEALHHSGIHRLLGSKWSGVGIIFTLHHIRPPLSHGGFWPNRILDITPEFLDAAIRQVKRAGYHIVSFDGLVQCLSEQRFDRKLAAFTVDDGYLDNVIYALPVFEKHEVPFTIYVASGLPDGEVVLWWEILEQLIRDYDTIEVKCGSRALALNTKSRRQKYKAFNDIYWALRSLPQDQQLVAIEEMIARYQVDWRDLCLASSLTWDMIRQLSFHPLATIGTHTVHHYALSKLQPEEVKTEVNAGRLRIEQETGILPMHFAYPYGDSGSAGSREFGMMRELGFASSTTTRKGVLFPEHAEHLQALPRVSLNGDYQKKRYVDMFLSGVPFALFNRFTRLNVN